MAKLGLALLFTATSSHGAGLDCQKPANPVEAILCSAMKQAKPNENVSPGNSSSQPAAPSSAPSNNPAPRGAPSIVGAWECLLDGRRDLERSYAYFDDGTFLIQGSGGKDQVALVSGNYSMSGNRLVTTESIAMVVTTSGTIVMPWSRLKQGSDLSTSNYKIHEFTVTFSNSDRHSLKRTRTSTGTGVSEAADPSEQDTPCVRADNQKARLARLRGSVPAALYAETKSTPKAPAKSGSTSSAATSPSNKSASNAAAFCARPPSLTIGALSAFQSNINKAKFLGASCEVAASIAEGKFRSARDMWQSGETLQRAGSSGTGNFSIACEWAVEGNEALKKECPQLSR